MPRTLFDKLWDGHCIATEENGESLLYIDRVCLHERTGGIALKSLEARDIPERRPGQAFCMMDHVLDTRPGRGDRTPIPGGEAFILRTREGAAAFGIRTFDVGDEDQGISHIVSAEQGIALPGLSLVCPDSHTCTLGALGALALGIGTSEAEHVLATSTLWLAKPASVRVVIDGELGPDANAKDLALYIIAMHGAGGAAGAAVEFSGAAVTALDIEARMTLCNMAVEFAAVTALIAPDEKAFSHVAGRAYAPTERPLAEWQGLKTDSAARFDKSIRIDASRVDARVIVAPSFGAIFRKNCIANGLLPAVVPDTDVRALARWVEDDPPSRLLAVDLVTSSIDTDLGNTPFAIGEADKARLLRGLDPISYTLTRADAIGAFEKERFKAHPWAALPIAANISERA